MVTYLNLFIRDWICTFYTQKRVTLQINIVRLELKTNRKLYGHFIVLALLAHLFYGRSQIIAETKTKTNKQKQGNKRGNFVNLYIDCCSKAVL